ncbi:MAG: DUF5676 family membrane protein [Anaerolineales bacterium]|nr:DUF5676 family membrane protein [Anaerolineales bacterium]
MKPLRFWPVAWSLAFFLAIIFTLDVVFGLLFPDWYVMQSFWELILPDYTFISWSSYLLGVLEAFLSGLFTAVIFVPLYNFFATRRISR